MVNIIQLFKHLSPDIKKIIISNIPIILPIITTNRIIHNYKALIFKELFRLHIDYQNVIKLINGFNYMDINTASLYQLNKIYNYIFSYYGLD